MRWLKRIIDTIVCSNIFIGACAVALALTNELTVDESINLDYSVGFVFFSTVFTYSFLKFRNTENSVVSTTHRNWADENPQLSKNILLISLIAAACFFLLLEWREKVIVLLLGLLTALYGFVHIPFLAPKKKLRDFGILKTVFVAVVWSVITVVVPLSDTAVDAEMMTFLLLRRFLFVLALTITFEIKDLKSDEEHQLHTLPMRLGIANTKLLAQGILLALVLILVVQYLFFNLSLANMVAVNLSLFASILCIQAVNEETGDLYYYLVLDGMMILQFLLVYFSGLFA